MLKNTGLYSAAPASRRTVLCFQWYPLGKARLRLHRLRMARRELPGALRLRPYGLPSEPEGPSLTELLIYCIKQHHAGVYDLGRKTGLQPCSIQRFRDYRQSLPLKSAEKLMAYFGVSFSLDPLAVAGANRSG